MGIGIKVAWETLRGFSCSFSRTTIMPVSYQTRIVKVAYFRYLKHTLLQAIKYEMHWLIAWTTGHTFLQIVVTFWDAHNWWNKCNSYAKGFPIDVFRTCKYENGPVCPCFPTGQVQSSKKADFSQVHCSTQFTTWCLKLSLPLKKLVWSWKLQHGSRGSCNHSLHLVYVL